MPKYFLFLFAAFSLFYFSCEKKTATKKPTVAVEAPQKTTPQKGPSIRNLMLRETKSAYPDTRLVRQIIADNKSEKVDNELEEHRQLSVKLLEIALKSYTNGSYQDCISKAAQVPLSDPVFTASQYLVAYSFFHTQAYERAAEIFKGMSQNQDFFKEINRKEAGYMHVLSQYNFCKKTNDEFQKKELSDAVDYFILKNSDNASAYLDNVKRLKEATK